MQLAPGRAGARAREAPRRPPSHWQPPARGDGVRGQSRPVVVWWVLRRTDRRLALVSHQRPQTPGAYGIPRTADLTVSPPLGELEPERRLYKSPTRWVMSARLPGSP